MKRSVSLLCALCMTAMCFFGIPAFAAGGSGTLEDPYIVGTAEELLAIDGQSAVYKVTADIDLGALTSDTVIESFSGTLLGEKADGSRPVISYTASGENAALIQVLNNGTVKGITVSGTSDGAYGNTAGLVGQAAGDLCTFEDCASNVNYTNIPRQNAFKMGGIIGEAKCKIIVKNCVNNGNFTGVAYNKTYNTIEHYWGGIVGYMEETLSDGSEFTGCYNYGNLTYATNAANGCRDIFGGIVGQGSKSTVTLCGNEGSLNGGSSLGGIVGAFCYVIDQCYNTGDLKALSYQAYIGGIAANRKVMQGVNYTQPAYDKLSVTNCFNSGNFTTYNGMVSGIVPDFRTDPATNAVEITRNYNTGSYAESHTTATGTYFAIYRYINSPANTSYNYIIEGVCTNNGVVRAVLTEEQMKDISNFVGISSNGLWAVIENAEYPYPQLIGNLKREGGVRYQAYPVSVSKSGNGTVSKNGNVYVKGGTTLSITATPVQGESVLKTIQYNDVDAAPMSTEAYTYTTPEITEAAAVNVIFEAIVQEEPSIAKTYKENIFTSTESVEINGETIEKPMGIVFAKVLAATGYELTDFGMEFAADQTALETGNGKEYSAVNGRSMLGNYGICFYGDFAKGATYYARPYAVYTKDGVPTKVTGEIMEFIPNP